MATALPERYHRTAALPDGRVLGYAEAGDPEGLALVLFHGTPSSRLDAFWLDDAARRHGWRLIAPDRPGHGLSSPQPGRELIDWPSDVEALADHLGLERFAVLGFSGGAPYALVTAERLRGRVSLVGLVSAWGPPDRPGAYDGVPFVDRLSDRLARSAPRVSRAGFAALRALLLRTPRLGAALLGLRLPTDPATTRWLAEQELPLGDESAADPDSMEAIGAVTEALRPGGAGPAEDLTLIVRPWGFPVGNVEAPVRLWHGSHDREVPIHHAEFLARIVPDGQVQVVDGGEHLMLFLEADTILAGLAAELRLV
ncbi:MAG TPA: alpha/beta hydrolase [Acidimicrobiales bacterium]